ncbi:MAG: diacylglycerol kinase family protein [Oscillospiraceae bacterium]|nr:diacylglycerol kinase family protein [Oscillospiraceae bacterium]
MRAFFKGFAYAGRGLALAFRERNFRFHLCAAGFVSWFAVRFYELTRAEWAILLLTFGAVMGLEAVNTALEHLADRVTRERDEHIRRCKDCAAGAVLVAAIFAVGVGAALFWDLERFAAIAEHFTSEPWRILALAAALAVAAAVVFGIKTKK